MSRVRRRTARVEDEGPGNDGLDGLVREQRPRAIRLATLLVADRAVAEEIVQDALLELTRRWDDLDNPAAYLRTTLVNRCRNHRRHLGVVRRKAPPPGPLHTDAPELDELWQVLAGLPPRRRAAGPALLRGPGDRRDRPPAGVPARHRVLAAAPGPRRPPKGAER